VSVQNHVPALADASQGVGLAFGPDVTQRFCEANGITSIIRSHEVRQEGYAIEQGGLCITVFSAPNYCDQTGNKVRPAFRLLAVDLA